MIFLLLAVAVSAVLLASPFVATPSSWTPSLDVLSGALGLILIGVGLYQRMHER